MPVINQLTLENTTGGDEELLAEISIMFVKLLPEIQARMRIGIENRKFEDVENAAHQMRSRIGYFGACELKEIASQLEADARNKVAENLQHSYHELFQGVDQLLEELRTITKLSLEVEDD